MVPEFSFTKWFILLHRKTKLIHIRKVGLGFEVKAKADFFSLRPNGNVLSRDVHGNGIPNGNGNPMGMGIKDEIGDGNEREWETTSIGM